MAEVVMVIGAVVGAVSSVNSMNTAKKSAAAQQKASNTQIQMQRTKATRERRQSIRANIAARARMRNQAELTGVAGSSGAQGGASSISSQGGANLGFSAQMSGLGQQFTAFSGQAASLASKSQSQAAMGSLGFQAYSFGSSVKEAGGFKKTFTA